MKSTWKRIPASNPKQLTSYVNEAVPGYRIENWSDRDGRVFVVLMDGAERPVHARPTLRQCKQWVEAVKAIKPFQSVQAKRSKGWPDLSRTTQALREYDLGASRRERALNFLKTQEDFNAYMEMCETDLKLVRDAFALDTNDRNSYDHAMLIDIHTLRTWCQLAMEQHSRCPFCNKHIENVKIYASCPHCSGSFSFAKPQ